MLLFLYFDFLYTTMGVKFGFALCLYIYSLHLLMNLQQRKSGLFWLIFCCCWHSSFVFTAPAVFVLYKLNLSRTKALWLCFALAIIMPILIHFAGSMLLGRRFDFYFSKKADDVTSYAAMTPIGLALYILPKLTIVPLAIILLKFLILPLLVGIYECGYFCLPGTRNKGGDSEKNFAVSTTGRRGIYHTQYDDLSQRSDVFALLQIIMACATGAKPGLRQARGILQNSA